MNYTFYKLHKTKILCYHIKSPIEFITLILSFKFFSVRFGNYYLLKFKNDTYNVIGMDC